MDRLQKWAHIAEITGAVAVVVSLLYVGYQVRENTAAQQSETEMNLFTLGFAWDEWWQDPEFVDIVARSSSDLNSLTEVERLRLQKYISLGLNLWAYSWKSHARGQIDDDEWRAWDNWFQSQMHTDAWLSAFEEFKPGYHIEFQRHVESVIEGR